MRKKNGVRFWGIACVFLCAAAGMLSGCHGKKSLLPFTMPEQFDTLRDYEITFWAKNDTNKTQTGIYEQAIADFENLYPNIKVNLRLYTDYGKIYNDVITNMATDTTPNVCITYPDHIATYLTGTNQVVLLDDLMEDKAYGLGGDVLEFDSPKKEEVVSKFLEECLFEGHYYALPFMRSTEACYINKTYVEALGYEIPDVLTWDFVWEVSEAATKQDADGYYRINGQKVMIPFIYKSTDNMMIQMLKQKGAGYSTAQGDILLFQDTTADLLEVIGEHAKTGAFSTFKISSYPANFLNAGQCIFAVDSTAGSTWMGTDAPLCDISEDKIAEFETEVRMIPQFDPEEPVMISQGPSICLFNKEDPQEVLASWLFMQYLLTDEVQIAYSQTEGYVPVTTKAQENEQYRDYLSRAGENDLLYYKVKLDAVSLLLDNMDRTFVTPVFNGSASLRDAAGQLIENTVKGVRRGQDLTGESLKSMFDDVCSLYHLDQINTGGAKQDPSGQSLGRLPVESTILLISLGVVWAGIFIFFLYQMIKKSRRKKCRT